MDLQKLTKEEENKYTRKLENLFFVNGRATLNELSGLGPRNQFSLGLFLKLGVKFDFIYSEQKFETNDQITSADSKKINFLTQRMKAFVKTETETKCKSTAVNILFQYNNEKDIEKIFEIMDVSDRENRLEGGIVFLVFVYLHEVQHILKRHTSEAFSNFMKNVAYKSLNYRLDDLQSHRFANIAEDFCINYGLMQILEKSKFSHMSSAIKENCLHDIKYNNHNEADILEDVLKTSPIMKVVSISEDSTQLEITSPNGDKTTISISNIKNPSKEETNDNKSQNGDINNDKLLDIIANDLQNLIDKQKGNKNFSLEQSVGESIKVDVSWFEKIRNNFFNLVNKKTKNYTTSWANLNPTFRHIYKSPIKRNLETKLNIILSIDNSGSMSMDSLKKILYIIEKKSHKINKITILAHDSNIGGVLENEKNPKAIIDFVSTRHCGGGTSHSPIFEYLEKNFKKDLKNTIYISFSDNYSDINETYSNFNVIKKIDKIWLNCNGIKVKVPGTQVDIY